MTARKRKHTIITTLNGKKKKPNRTVFVFSNLDFRSDIIRLSKQTRRGLFDFTVNDTRTMTVQ